MDVDPDIDYLTSIARVHFTCNHFFKYGCALNLQKLVKYEVSKAWTKESVFRQITFRTINTFSCPLLVLEVFPRWKWRNSCGMLPKKNRMWVNTSNLREWVITFNEWKIGLEFKACLIRKSDVPNTLSVNRIPLRRW